MRSAFPDCDSRLMLANWNDHHALSLESVKPHPVHL
jgi:hypothetical protein